jgi:hypothetical protein
MQAYLPANHRLARINFQDTTEMPKSLVSRMGDMVLSA